MIMFRLPVASASRLVVVALLVGCGATAGPDRSTPRPALRTGTASSGTSNGSATPQAKVVSPDAAAASRVDVQATSVRERAIVRRILAALGSHDPIRSVSLAPTRQSSTEPTITVTPSPHAVASPEFARGEFEAMIVGDAIGRLLPRYKYLTIAGPNGFGSRLDHSPPAAAVTPAALGASIQAGVSAAGLGVRAITVFALPVPAVETVIRLPEAELFDDDAHHWEAAIEAGPAGRPAAGFLAVQSPSGATISSGGHVGATGFGAAGQPPTAPVPQHAPPALYRKPTRLTITLRRPALAGSPGLDTVWTLDCRQPTTSTLPHPQAACDRVIRDRWALFAPTESGSACSLPQGGDTIEIRGAFAGQTIDYTTDGCTGWTLRRWELFLHVAPRHL